MNVVATLVLLSVAIFLVIISRRIAGDFLPPITLIVVVNIVSFAVYYSGILGLSSVSPETILIPFMGILFFILGALISPIQLRRILQWKKNQNIITKSSIDNSKIFFWIIVFLSSIGWSTQLYIFLVNNPDFSLPSLQTDFQRPGLAYMNVLGALGVPFFCYLLAARGTVSKAEIVGVFLSFFGLILAGVKSYVVFAISLGIFVSLAISPEKVKVRHVVLVFIALLVFWVGYAAFIDIYAVRYIYSSQLPNALRFLEQPLIYVAGSWPAMEQIRLGVVEQTVFGQVTLNWLWVVVNKLRDNKVIESNQEPYVDIGPIDFNTYGMFGGVYWDYGWAGVALFGGLLGLIANSLYCSARETRHPVVVIINAIFQYATALSFFVYRFRIVELFLIIFVCFGWFAVGCVRVALRRRA